MAIKTTGIEFKKFYSDRSIWQEGWWHEDEFILIDGIPSDEFDGDYDQLNDNCKISISGGVVFDEENEAKWSFESFFKKWKKSQSTTYLSIEIENTKLEELKALVLKIGGKIIK